MASRVTYRKAAEEVVGHLVKEGADLSIRYAYNLYGLSNKDGSIDLSVLYSAKEFLIFMRGFQAGRTLK